MATLSIDSVLTSALQAIMLSIQLVDACPSVLKGYSETPQQLLGNAGPPQPSVQVVSETATCDSVCPLAPAQPLWIPLAWEMTAFHVRLFLFLVCTTGFADNYTGTRLCVDQCPGTVDSLAAPNYYGDPETKKCVLKCITPETWADPHTRKCEPVCSSTPALYAENFTMTCVAALDCPLTPTMTFGDSNNRYCVSFCSDGEFGDPTSRNCVDQCPKQADTGTEHYYGDTSTGQYICVTVCPEEPRLFGQNSSNLCVDECAGSSWGDQTGKRTCVPVCPTINTVKWYAQNF